MVKKFLRSATSKVKRRYDRAIAWIAMATLGITGCGFLAKNIAAADFNEVPRAALSWTPKPAKKISIISNGHMSDAKFLQQQLDLINSAAPQVIDQLRAFGTVFKVLTDEPQYDGYNMFIDFNSPDTVFVMQSNIRAVRSGKRSQHLFRESVAHELQHQSQIYAKVLAHLSGMTQEEAKIAYTFIELDAQIKGFMNFDIKKYKNQKARDTALGQQIDQFRDRIANIKKSERNKFGGRAGEGVDDATLLDFMRGVGMLGDERIAGYSDAALFNVLTAIKKMESVRAAKPPIAMRAAQR